MPLTPGTRVGAYDVTGPLGAGGMGEVYRARDTKLDRDVALKVLPEAFTADPDRLARFEREARVLASLNHPNIAQIHGLEETGGTRALVLELVEGPTLADRLAQGPIPLDEVLSIAWQIAFALQGAHEAGVVHRDLKPPNIKVRDDGTVKVLDFGLAKALDPAPAAAPPPEADTLQSPTLTASVTRMGAGLILGTPAYMSPEQAEGQPTDTRADLWSFGVILYEMLAGERLFAGETVAQVLARVIDRDLDLSVLPPSTPKPVRRLLGRCLERDRRRRMRDAGEAISDLEAAASASEAPPPRPPARRRGSRAARRTAGPLAAVGRRRGRRPGARRPGNRDGALDARARTRAARGEAPLPRPAVSARARLRGGVGHLRTDGPSAAPASDPTGAREARGRSHDPARSPVRRRPPGAPLPVVPDAGSSAWSADGTLVYAAGAGVNAAETLRTLVWMDRDGLEEALSAAPRAYSGPRISPSGDRVAVEVSSADGAAVVVVYDLAREASNLLTFDAWSVNPLWSPDGRRVVFSSIEQGSFGLFRKAADGTGQTERLTDAAATRMLMASAWVETSDTLVVTQAASMTDADIHLLPLDDSSGSEPLIATASVEVLPEVSPDGRWIAYQSNESGRWAIYVRPFPNVDDGKWQVSQGTAFSPVWSPDGRELFFLAAGPDGRAMMAVEYAGDPTFTPSRSRRLFTLSSRVDVGGIFRQWDVAPDGRRFLMIKDQDGAAGDDPRDGVSELIYVGNWFRELVERVPLP